LIIFGHQHQHTFRNNMHVQLSLSLHFYLFYLLLNSCDGNDAFWRLLVKQSSSFSRKHQTLCLQICIRQTVQLTTECVDWCRSVCTLYKHLSATPALWPATWSSASLTHGQAYHKTSLTKQLVNGKSSYMQARRQMTSLWTSATLKPAVFRANTLHNRFFSEPLTVYWGKHVVLHHFHHSHLKANKVSKSEGTRKVKYAYYCWKCADAVDRKLSKLVHACRSYSLPKLAHFFETQCISGL